MEFTSSNKTVTFHLHVIFIFRMIECFAELTGAQFVAADVAYGF
jgi:hypothetical protein